VSGLFCIGTINKEGRKYQEIGLPAFVALEFCELHFFDIATGLHDKSHKATQAAGQRLF
jgi:hypothetical protein